MVSKLAFPMGRDGATFRDKGTEIPSLSRTSSKSCHGTGRDFDSLFLSRDVPQDRNERKSVEKIGFFSIISCFRTSFPVLERPYLN